MAGRPFPGRNIFTFHCFISTLHFCTCSSWVHTVRPHFFASTVSWHCKGPRGCHQGITQPSLATWVCHSSEEAATTVLSHSQLFFSQTYLHKVRLLTSMQRFHILKFPPLCFMEKAAHTACKLFKSLSLCQFGLLSSQEMLLPPPAQRTSTLFKCSKSNHYSSWKEQNITLWGYKLQESFGVRRKDPGKKKTQVPKEYSTLWSTEKDLAKDWILFKGLHK